MQDQAIIDLYIERNERAIEETAAKYGAYCNKIAYNILRDVFDAEECVNDTYLRVWNTVPPTVPNIFSAFLAKITRNLAIDRYNKSHSQKRDTGVTASLDELTECVGDGDLSDELETALLGKAISAFLTGEKPLTRRIFIRKYFFEDTLSEIAKSHGMSEANVKVTLHRARARLRDYLVKEGFFI